MPGFKDLTGHRFGRLTVLYLGERVVDTVHWVCKCDCGKERNVRAGYLRDGDVKSCGCWSREQSQINVKQAHISRTKHKTGSITKAKEVLFKSYSKEEDTITFEEFLEITKQDCYYCGEPPSNMKKGKVRKMDEDKKDNEKHFIYNGMDRVDNTKPHTKENCVPCCKYCNYAKRTLSSEEFFILLQNIKNNLRLK